ncbi:MAG: FecR family protein [Chitinophagaceae bacterium]|nr:FecR family protein [Chitinophagaceae bacterium]
MDTNERFIFLLQQFRDGNISIVEQDELFSLIASHEFDHLLEQQISRDIHNQEKTGADLPPHVSQEIIRNILSAEKMTAKIIPAKRSYKTWYWSAAAVLIMALVSYFFLSGNNNTARSFSEVIPVGTIAVNNSSDTTRTINLSDGSKITLQPQSTLHYPDQFSDSIREVYFEGQAFFEIAHNAKKPFLVYSNRIITKVLGTSFYIDTKTTNGNEEVSVRTGKVQVFENSKMQIKKQQAPSVIIIPNQRAIYEPAKRIFETTLVEKPHPIIREPGARPDLNVAENKNLIYEQERLQNIFRQLEEIYGIEIIIDNQDLNNCVFTGDLSDEDLFTKLKIICLTTGSSYEINNTKILVKGQGCN